MSSILLITFLFAFIQNEIHGQDSCSSTYKKLLKKVDNLKTEKGNLQAFYFLAGEEQKYAEEHCWRQ